MCKHRAKFTERYERCCKTLPTEGDTSFVNNEKKNEGKKNNNDSMPLSES